MKNKSNLIFWIIGILGVLFILNASFGSLGLFSGSTLTCEDLGYKEGQGFYSACNACSCQQGAIMCTKQVCPPCSGEWIKGVCESEIVCCEIGGTAGMIYELREKKNCGIGSTMRVVSNSFCEEQEETVCCKITVVYPGAEPTYSWEEKSYCSNIINGKPIEGAGRSIVSNSFCEEQEECLFKINDYCIKLWMVLTLVGVIVLFLIGGKKK